MKPMVLAALVALVPCTMSAEEKHHTLSGLVQKVEDGGKKITVKTKDGAEYVIHVAGHTAVHAGKGIEKGAEKAGAAMAGAVKSGSHAVVHFTEESGNKTAHALKVVGKASANAARGTVVKVDHAAHTIAVKTKDGATETYNLAKDGLIACERAAAHASEAALHTVAAGAKEIEKAAVSGAEWVIHYTEEEGRKVAHALHELGA
jgi:arginine repressor